MQRAQPAAQFLAHLGVQRAERLVQQQHVRLDGQRARQRHPLPLPARKLRRIAIRPSFPAGPVPAARRTRRRISLSAGRTFLGRTRSPKAMFSNTRHVAEQRVVLEDEAHLPLVAPLARDVLAVEEHRRFVMRIGVLQTGDDSQQRGLAGTRRAQQRHQLAVLHRQAHVAQSRQRAERSADVPASIDVPEAAVTTTPPRRVDARLCASSIRAPS